MVANPAPLMMSAKTYCRSLIEAFIPGSLCMPSCSRLSIFEGGAMNFIEKSAITTNEYWLRVYRS